MNVSADATDTFLQCRMNACFAHTATNACINGGELWTHSKEHGKLMMHLSGNRLPLDPHLLSSELIIQLLCFPSRCLVKI